MKHLALTEVEGPRSWLEPSDGEPSVAASTLWPDSVPVLLIRLIAGPGDPLRDLIEPRPRIRQ